MPDRSLVVSVDGISGSGKSTVVARAAARFGWVPLAEAYDRLDPRPDLGVRSAPALARLERRLLGEESLRYAAARALATLGTTVVTDTGFLGPLTYSAALVRLGAAPPSLLRHLRTRAVRLAARGAWGMPDLVVYLATRASTRRGRTAADAARHPPRLARRHEAAGRLEERFYAELLPDALPGRVRVLDADRPADRVVAALGRLVRDARPLGGRTAAARRALALFERFPTAPSATVKKTALCCGAPWR